MRELSYGLVCIAALAAPEVAGAEASPSALPMAVVVVDGKVVSLTRVDR